jgi:DNA-binding MarR family transcriptional regulator
MPASEFDGSPSSIHAADLERRLASAVAARVPGVDQRVLKAATNLKRAATVLDQVEIRDLHSFTGRTTAAFRVLVVIWAFGPTEAREVARLSGVSRQAVSSVLTTLERDGLISRERATKADKRLVPITITPEGAELVEQHLVPQNEVQQAFFEVLAPEELETLMDLLGRLIITAHG